MRTSGNDHADPVITSDDAAIANDGHDSTLEYRRPCVPVLCNRPLKLFSKPLDFRLRDKGCVRRSPPRDRARSCFVSPQHGRDGIGAPGRIEAVSGAVRLPRWPSYRPSIDVGLGVYKANEISVCHFVLQFIPSDYRFWLGSSRTRTCCGTPVAMRRPTRAAIHAGCKPISATATFSTPCAIPSCRRTASRTSGGSERRGCRQGKAGVVGILPSRLELFEGTTKIGSCCRDKVTHTIGSVDCRPKAEIFNTASETSTSRTNASLKRRISKGPRDP